MFLFRTDCIAARLLFTKCCKYSFCIPILVCPSGRDALSLSACVYVLVTELVSVWFALFRLVCFGLFWVVFLVWGLFWLVGLIGLFVGLFVLSGLFCVMDIEYELDILIPFQFQFRS